VFNIKDFFKNIEKQPRRVNTIQAKSQRSSTLKQKESLSYLKSDCLLTLRKNPASRSLGIKQIKGGPS
jgi:hypothetical protein